MGSLLGNYIHLSAKNYEKQGINRWNDHGARNVTTSVFTNHQNSILKQAEKFRVSNLKQIEKTYNEMNLAQYQEMKKLITDMSHPRKALALAKNLIEQLGNFTNAEIQEIVNNLKWDDARQTIYYAGSGLKNTGSTKLSMKQLGTAQSFRYINTIMNRCNELLQSIAVNEQLGDAAKSQYSQEVRDIMEALQKQEGYQERTEEQLKKLGKKAQKYKGMLSIDEANVFYQKLLSITKTTLGIQKLNSDLQWRFAELLGNLIGETGTQIGYNAVYGAVQQGLQMGKTQTVSNKGGIALTGYLDIDTLDKAGVRLTQNGVWNDAQGYLRSSYIFEGIGDPRNQKADVVLTLSTEEKPINISLKNTALTKRINDQSQVFMKNDISLQQNSSLMLYLMGMSQNDVGIANHYLNILADHPDGEVSSGIRKAALDSLKLALFYSALTGANQLRQGGQTSVFAIYDKKKDGINQIKFFDTYSLVQSAARNPDVAARFSPHLENIKLKNEKETEAATINENTNIRITKILLEARSKNISVYIAKQFLIDAYK